MLEAIYGQVQGGRTSRDGLVVTRFAAPLVTTGNGVILDGLERWQAAVARRQPTIPCLEQDLTEPQALHAILEYHGKSRGLNAFNRIVVALELEPHLRSSVARQRKGLRPSSDLTNSHRDVRAEIAAAAGVSAGNVTAVKNILKGAIPDVVGALRRGEIRIHRALKWCRLSAREQRDALSEYRNRHSLSQTISRLVNGHRKALSGPCPCRADVLNALTRGLPNCDLGAVAVSVVETPGPAVALTRDLYEKLKAQEFDGTG